MPSRKNTRQQFFDDIVLADDDLPQFRPNAPIEVAELIDRLNICFLGAGGGRESSHLVPRKTAEHAEKFTRKVVNLSLEKDLGEERPPRGDSFKIGGSYEKTRDADLPDPLKSVQKPAHNHDLLHGTDICGAARRSQVWNTDLWRGILIFGAVRSICGAEYRSLAQSRRSLAQSDRSVAQLRRSLAQSD